MIFGVTFTSLALSAVIVAVVAGLFAWVGWCSGYTRAKDDIVAMVAEAANRERRRPTPLPEGTKPEAVPPPVLESLCDAIRDGYHRKRSR